MARTASTTKKTTTSAKAEKAPVEEQNSIAPAGEQPEAKPESAEEIRAEYEKKFAELQESMNAQLEAMKAQMAQSQMPQIVQVAADVPKVHFLWMAEVADDNVQNFGQGGMYARIVGKRGDFIMPKTELSRILDKMTRSCLDKRWLIVLSGLTDEERDALGVAYKEGELLDKQAFAKMVEMEDGILEIYPELCDGHKEMVAKRYYEAWMSHNPHVHRNVVLELKRMTQEAGMKNNVFSDILKEMNEAEAK